MKVTITPEKAKEMLELSEMSGFRNRNVTNSHVKYIANQMSRGAFEYNGEPIIIGTSLEVLDGQHRLLACIKSGVEFETELVEGVPPCRFATIDTGKNRSGGDVLTVEGYKHAKTLASTIRAILCYRRGSFCYTGTRIDNMQIINWAENDGIVHQAVQAGRSLSDNNRKLISPSNASVAIYMAAVATNIDYSIGYFSNAINGVGLKLGTPQHALHRRLTNNTTVKGYHTLAFCAISWRLHVSGKKSKLIRFEPQNNQDWPVWLGLDLKPICVDRPQPASPNEQ